MLEFFMSGLAVMSKVVGATADVATLYGTVGAIHSGKQIDRLVDRVGRLEKLTENVLASLEVVEVALANHSQTQQIRSLSELAAMLTPLQRSIDSPILATGVIHTPAALRAEFNKNPWDVLINIRPAALVEAPADPALVSMQFEFNGQFYIGWAPRGILRSALGVEYEPLEGEAGGTASPRVHDVPSPVEAARLFVPKPACLDVEGSLALSLQPYEAPDQPAIFSAPAADAADELQRALGYEDFWARFDPSLRQSWLDVERIELPYDCRTVEPMVWDTRLWPYWLLSNDVNYQHKSDGALHCYRCLPGRRVSALRPGTRVHLDCECDAWFAVVLEADREQRRFRVLTYDYYLDDAVALITVQLSPSGTSTQLTIKADLVNHNLIDKFKSAGPLLRSIWKITSNLESERESEALKRERVHQLVVNRLDRFCFILYDLMRFGSIISDVMSKVLPHPMQVDSTLVSSDCFWFSADVGRFTPARPLTPGTVLAARETVGVVAKDGTGDAEVTTPDDIRILHVPVRNKALLGGRPAAASYARLFVVELLD